jgi:hypothetical protein
MKILLEKKNKPNSQTHYLFLNDEHPINSITTEIESVKQFIQSMNEPIKELGHLLAEVDLNKTLDSDSSSVDTAMSIIFTYRLQLHGIIFVLAHKTFELVHSLNAVRKISQDLVILMMGVANQLSDLDHWLTVYRTEKSNWLKQSINQIKQKRNRLKEELEKQDNDNIVESDLIQRENDLIQRERRLNARHILLEKVSEIMTKVQGFSERFKLI